MSTPSPKSLPEDDRSRRRRTTLLLLLVVLLAILMRLPGLFKDLPFSYHGDELHFIKRSMALGTGDLNPHWFHKPAFLMYLLALCYGVFYVVGALTGRFESTEAFGAHFLAEPGDFILIGRCLVAAFGVATVYLVYRLGRRCFGRAEAGLAGALVAAVLPPMVDASQSVKADVPAGFFVTLALLVYLRTRKDARLRPMILASALAGVGMGTKYYGIILVPVFGLAELARRWTVPEPWKRVLLRGSLVLAAFLVAFFVVSPYNFLDPTWGRTVFAQVSRFVSGDAQPVYDPDNQVVFTPGASSLPGATVHFLDKIKHPGALGWPLSLLAGLGVLVAVITRRTRWVALLLVGPFLVFMAIAVTLTAYHTNPRHLNALYPLLVVFVYPSLSVLTSLVSRRERLQASVAVALLLAAVAPSAARATRYNLEKVRLDSRTVAHDWLVENLPRGAYVLLDEYGPVLQPDAQSVSRLRERLRSVPAREAFTKHQGLRLDLLHRYPPSPAFNFDELAHPWWLDRELSEEELHESWKHRDMGNPLKRRVAPTVEGVRAEGVRFVVTNSEAQARYFDKHGAEKAFPSFVRFYRDLRDLAPVKTFDPAEWDGKGPTIWVYDLRSGQE